MSTFDINIDIRFRDIDAMGHVNNAVYLTYFEEGRKHFFQQVFHTSGANDFPIILAHVSCDYLKPVTINDQPILKMWIDDIRHKSFMIVYELTNNSDESYAKGRSIQVWFDYTENRSIAVPKDMREKLSAYCIS